MYETKISTPLWLAYDLPGNIGWIMYFIGLGRFLAKNGLSQHLIAGIFLIIPALLMLIGLVELISERIAKLDRVLPAVRLWRGFGALTLGGVLGILVSAATSGANISTANWVMMLIGSVLCAVFAGLLLVGYKRQK